VTIALSIIGAVLWISMLGFFAGVDKRWSRRFRRLERRVGRNPGSHAACDATHRPARLYDYAEEELQREACAALEERLRGVLR